MPPPVVVIGGGVVGAAVLHALTRRGVPALLLEAGPALGLQASGTNSGILHTGFDSKPGELETQLILASVALRPELHAELGITELRCGAVMTPRDNTESGAVTALADNARRNGVSVDVDGEGRLHVPGEWVCDPVDYVLRLAGSAVQAGAVVRTGCRVTGLRPADGGLDVEVVGEHDVRATAVVNCAGLRADEVARMAGDDHIDVYPRKGVFVVFRPDRALPEIRLPVPSPGTKGVLLFPTIDGHVIAGPTAEDLEDKDDWSATPASVARLTAQAMTLAGDLELGPVVGAYAGLRPAGRGTNYLVGASPTMPGVVHAAAIRSTGLSASLGIAEHVVGLVAETGVPLGATRPLPPPAAGVQELTWWRRTARHVSVAA